MNKLQRVIDAARDVSPELADALVDLYAGKVYERQGKVYTDSSRVITLSDGREAHGFVIVSGREGFDVVEVAPELESFVFVERKGHTLLGVSDIRYAARLTMTFQEIPFSDVGGKGPDVRLLTIS